MENNATKVNKKGLPSTIILGIILVVLLVLFIILYSLRIGEVISSTSSSSTSSLTGEEQAGRAIGGVFAGLAIAVFEVLGLGITGILTLIGLIFSFKNIKLENKIFKIINLVYVCLYFISIVAIILKIAVFF